MLSDVCTTTFLNLLNLDDSFNRLFCEVEYTLEHDNHDRKVVLSDSLVCLVDNDLKTGHYFIIDIVLNARSIITDLNKLDEIVKNHSFYYDDDDIEFFLERKSKRERVVK